MDLLISFNAFALVALLLNYHKSDAATGAASLSRNARETHQYTTRYDNVDIDHILKSRRLLLSYTNCLLEKGPCTREGQLLKDYVPDALHTECSKCSDMQKKQAGKVFSYLLLHYRDVWEQLVDKYDPEGNFRKKHGFDEEDYDYTQLDSAK